MKLKYKIMLALIVVAMGICFMTLQSYALWIARYESGENIAEVGCYSIDFAENQGPISLNNTYPMSDTKALNGGVYYSFTVRNTCTTDSKYAVTINPLKSNTLTKDKIKYAIYKSTETKPTSGINLGTVTNMNDDLSAFPNASSINESLIVAEGFLKGATTSGGNDGESVTYILYLWMDENDTLADKNKTFEASVYVSNVAKKKIPTGAETIAKIVEGSDPNSTAVIDKGTDASGCTNTLAYDDFGNLRYVGKNPCNYVTFNNEAPTLEVVGYDLYVDGDISTGNGRIEGSGFADLSACQTAINNGIGGVSIDGTVECATHEDTGKVYVKAKGFMTWGPPVASTKEQCEQWSASYINEITGGYCKEKSSYNGWRIIGVVDNQIKLIRNESIGEYSWDTSASSVNSGYGINQWGESGEYKGADLMKLLNPGYDMNLAEDASGNTIAGTYANNSLYWNKQSGNCYTSTKNAYTTCDFSTTGLTETAKNMIDKHTWNLGSNDGTTYTYNNIKAKPFYELERSNNTGKICEGTTYQNGKYCTDTVNRTTTWEGYVGLMSPSDYGYAVGGEARTNCLANTNLFNYNTNNCNSNDWLYKTSTSQWTMSPNADSSDAVFVFYVYSGGNVYDASACSVFSVRPALFLIPSITISGEGTPTDPYTLSLN